MPVDQTGARWEPLTISPAPRESLCAYGPHTAPFEPWASYDRFDAYALLHRSRDAHPPGDADPAGVLRPPGSRGWLNRRGKPAGKGRRLSPRNPQMPHNDRG